MYNIIESYINKLTKEDIYKFAIKNNLKVSEDEISFIYIFIKKNYGYYLKNPNSLDISKYKNKFSNENYIFLNNLIDKYKRMIT